MERTQNSTSKLYSTFFSTPKNNFSEVDRKKCAKKSENFRKSFRVLKIFLCKLQRKIFKTLKDFQKISLFFTFFFRSTSEKIFFGVENKSWVQFRCKKLRPFDLWCFQRVLSTLTPSSKRLHYFLAFTCFFVPEMSLAQCFSPSHLFRNAELKKTQFFWLTDSTQTFGILGLHRIWIYILTSVAAGTSPPSPRARAGTSPFKNFGAGTTLNLDVL